MLRPYRIVPRARLTEAADTLRGHDHVVEPHAAETRVCDVVLRPEVVQLQIRGGPELDVRGALCGGRVVALRAVGTNRAEMVLHPVPGPRGIGEALDEDVVLPHFEHRASVRC